DGRLRVRRLRGVSGRGGGGDRARAGRVCQRERARGASGRRRDRGRPGDRYRLLRQGRSARCSRGGAATRAHRRADGRRDGRMSADLEAAARRAVEAAIAAGASDAEGYAEEGVEREIRVYDGAVESLTDAASRGVGVRAFLDARSGYAYGTDLSDSGLGDVGAAATEAARVADPDEHDGLPEETGAAAVGDLRSREVDRFTTERKVELALRAERAARAHPSVSQVEQVVYA